MGAQQKNAVVLSTKQNTNDQDQEQRSQGASWGAFGVGLLGAGLAFTAPLLADEGKKKVFGKTAYKQISNSELNSNYVVDMNKLPVKGSNLLNAINDHGLLSYTDFHFLLLLMSTPTRYLDIIFHGFDISADGSVEAKVDSHS